MFFYSPLSHILALFLFLVPFSFYFFISQECDLIISILLWANLSIISIVLDFLYASVSVFRLRSIFLMYLSRGLDPCGLGRLFDIIIYWLYANFFWNFILHNPIINPHHFKIFARTIAKPGYCLSYSFKYSTYSLPVLPQHQITLNSHPWIP